MLNKSEILLILCEFMNHHMHSQAWIECTSQQTKFWDQKELFLWVYETTKFWDLKEYFVKFINLQTQDLGPERMLTELKNQQAKFWGEKQAWVNMKVI